MKELWELFSSFARIGGFTFGGGYAMLPMLQKEVVEKRPRRYFYQYGDLYRL